MRLGRLAALVRLTDNNEVRVVQMSSLFDAKDDLMDFPKIGLTVRVQGLGFTGNNFELRDFLLGKLKLTRTQNFGFGNT